MSLADTNKNDRSIYTVAEGLINSSKVRTVSLSGSAETCTDLVESPIFSIYSPHVDISKPLSLSQLSLYNFDK